MRLQLQHVLLDDIGGLFVVFVSLSTLLHHVFDPLHLHVHVRHVARAEGQIPNVRRSGELLDRVQHRRVHVLSALVLWRMEVYAEVSVAAFLCH